MPASSRAVSIEKTREAQYGNRKQPHVRRLREWLYRAKIQERGMDLLSLPIVAASSCRYPAMSNGQ